MYFESRSEAGRELAQQLVGRYRYENCAVVALNDGGVLVGEQIAAYLHSVLMLLLVETIDIPGESLSFGGVSQNGHFTYNSEFSQGEIDEYTAEYNGYLQEQQRETFQKINRMVGDGGTMNSDLLRDRHVILVSDGFADGSALDAVIDFLKPVRIERLIIVSPVASASAVDKLHVVADELHLLDIKDNYLTTDHYYNVNTIPSHEETIDKINKIVLNWR